MVFDDLFQTVFSSGYDDALVDTICNNLFECNRDVYAEEDFDSSGKLIYHPPPLDEVWLDESERRDRCERLCRKRDITEERERSKGFVFQFLHFHLSPLVLMRVQFHLS